MPHMYLILELVTDFVPREWRSSKSRVPTACSVGFSWHWHKTRWWGTLDCSWSSTLSSKSTVRGIFSLGDWKSREQEIGWEEEREQESKTGMW